MLTLDFSATSMTAPVDEQRWALDLFQKSFQEGRLMRWLRRLAGRQVGLRCLGAAEQRGGRDMGHQTVAIGEIVGSEGRTRDFDRAFAPISERSRDRWMSVAQARFRGRALPAVLLVRAEDGYYVRDGHHRISVARALGEEFVEAEVITW
ncbi:MAG TPA: hypothetical protein PKD53_05455 [Chloroflexaceae bacterium]|nr:hypothetical protein [Chloroflexaceae bacterium]